MKTTDRIVFWAPRIICILTILFVSLFALDSFRPGLSVWQQLGAFLIHLIPSFLLIALLIVAWRWEFIGGVTYFIIGLVLSPFVFIHNFRMNHSVWMSTSIILMITFPFMVAGLLFILGHYRQRRRHLVKD